MNGITGEHYAIDDVLPTLDLHPAVEVRIDIEEQESSFPSGRGSEWLQAGPTFAR